MSYVALLYVQTYL